MKKYMIILSAAVLVLSTSVSAYENETGESCESCHTRETPDMIRIWKNSAHMEKGLECADCHDPHEPDLE